MSMSHFCRAWWARWGLGSLTGGKRYHFNSGYTTNDLSHSSTGPPSPNEVPSLCNRMLWSTVSNATYGKW